MRNGILLGEHIQQALAFAAAHLDDRALAVPIVLLTPGLLEGRDLPA
jgi:hypothetical protein